MELMVDKVLESGESLRIWHWQAPEVMPDRYRNFIISAFSQQGGVQNYFAGGWTSYIVSTASGEEYPTIKDHWFIAEVDGSPAARLWFAYAPRSGRGNFGNVETLPMYRRRGLLNELLNCFKIIVEKCDDMKMLCCVTGNGYAADSYRKVGFNTAFGGRTGIMCFCKSGTFMEESARAFAGNGISSIRAGQRDDQYDIDKFLLFQSELFHNSYHKFCGYATWFAEFRVIYQEAKNGNGVVLVAENEQGTIVAYCYALLVNCTPFFNFICHPSYYRGAEKLLKRTAALFYEKFKVQSHLLCQIDDNEKISIAERAGAKAVATLPGYMHKGDGFVDVRDFII